MKKLLPLLVVVALISACKKQNVEPATLAGRIAGQYQLQSIRLIDANTEILDLSQMPGTYKGKRIAGTLEVTELSVTQVTLKPFLQVDGQNNALTAIEEVDVEESGKVYALLYEGERIADADGENIIFNVTYTDPQTNKTTVYAFTAKK
jgi:uncharacterized protein YrzB (UPF0473 family)